MKRETGSGRNNGKLNGNETATEILFTHGSPHREQCITKPMGMVPAKSFSKPSFNMIANSVIIM